MGIVLRWKNLNIVFEIDILTNYSQTFFGVSWGVIFEGLGVQKTP